MDINQIITESGMRFKVVAEALFPDNAHPYYALKRVIKKGVPLNAEQVQTLSNIARIPVEELLPNGFKNPEN